MLLQQVVQMAHKYDLSTIIATPTGILASQYTELVDIECGTIHSIFKFPYEQHVDPQINWNLCKYDVFLIDEVLINDFFRNFL